MDLKNVTTLHLILNAINTVLVALGRQHMEHYPSESGFTEMWQYDEYDQEETGMIGGLTIQVTTYTSRLLKPSISIVVMCADGRDYTWRQPLSDFEVEEEMDFLLTFLALQPRCS